MAEVFDDGAFWLPSQFLTDDDLFMDGGKAKSNPKKFEDGSGLDLDGSKSLFPYEFPYEFGSLGFSSDPSSPVESVVGSTETVSDEEDYLAGLTRQMAHSTLGNGIRRNDIVFASENPKGWVSSSSPRSTLCSLRSGCGCMQGSSRGSLTGKSRVSSPPGTWDLLNAAAAEVAYGGVNRGLLRSPATKLPQNVDVSGFWPPPQSLIRQKMQAAKFQILKQQQQQLMKQQNASIWGGQKQHHQVVKNRVRSTNGPVGLSPSAWQQTQMRNGSGMRAVFLGNPTAERECAGTGVFLPRRIGAPSEPCKKPAYPTVVRPARVVQALNLNVDEIGAQPQFHPRFNPNLTGTAEWYKFMFGISYFMVYMFLTLMRSMCADAALKHGRGGKGKVFSNKKQRNLGQHDIKGWGCLRNGHIDPAVD
ncbi:hypothetical protein V6N13_100923 [Hibiscus sabdariffa]|uniref:Uncharacterized protein n=1 Tax=Hibiscus sabdariffa TaxID=183260 RepID=A0ABR2QJZ0_9ROSI